MHSVNTTLVPREVRIPVGDLWLYGDLVMPSGFQGLVLFAHGSGSGRHSARNRQVAQHLQHAGIATLLFDLLTAQEEQIDLHTREPVSYTHLRAHETRHDLVCRLLLEKKKKK